MNKNMFEERIKELMNQSNLNQKQLAIKVGVTEVCMSRYIKGERQPDVEIVANMATALNTTTDYLLGRTETDMIESDFGRVRMFVARNSNKLSLEQKEMLIKALLSEVKGE